MMCSLGSVLYGLLGPAAPGCVIAASHSHYKDVKDIYTNTHTCLLHILSRSVCCCIYAAVGDSFHFLISAPILEWS